MKKVTPDNWQYQLQSLNNTILDLIAAEKRILNHCDVAIFDSDYALSRIRSNTERDKINKIAERYAKLPKYKGLTSSQILDIILKENKSNLYHAINECKKNAQASIKRIYKELDCDYAKGTFEMVVDENFIMQADAITRGLQTLPQDKRDLVEDFVEDLFDQELKATRPQHEVENVVDSFYYCQMVSRKSKLTKQQQQVFAFLNEYDKVAMSGSDVNRLDRKFLLFLKEINYPKYDKLTMSYDDDKLTMRYNDIGFLSFTVTRTKLHKNTIKKIK